MKSYNYLFACCALLLNNIFASQAFINSNFQGAQNSNHSECFPCKFKVISYIGSGSFAKVFKVKFIHNEQQAAIKVLPKSTNLTKNHQRSIINEISAMERLGSCKVFPKYYGSFIGRYNVYIIMEYMDLGDLTDLMSYHMERHLDFDQSLLKCISKNLVKALSFLHSQNIIHRDIKPDNIFLDRQGNFKLADLGLADVGRYSSDEPVTSNRISGTRDYLSPEVFKMKILNGPNVTTAVDVWALAVTLFYVSSLKLPFSFSYNASKSLEGMWTSIRTTDPDFSIAGKYGNEYIIFLKDCFALEPHNRPCASDLLGYNWVNSSISRKHVVQILDKYSSWKGENAAESSIQIQRTFLSNHISEKFNAVINRKYWKMANRQLPLCITPVVSKELDNTKKIIANHTIRHYWLAFVVIIYLFGLFHNLLAHNI